MITITITAVGDDISIKLDPPTTTDAEKVRGMLLGALISAAVNCRISRERLAAEMRDFADQIETLTDEEYERDCYPDLH